MWNLTHCFIVLFFYSCLIPGFQQLSACAYLQFLTLSHFRLNPRHDIHVTHSSRTLQSACSWYAVFAAFLLKKNSVYIWQIQPILHLCLLPQLHHLVGTLLIRYYINILWWPKYKNYKAKYWLFCMKYYIYYIIWPICKSYFYSSQRIFCLSLHIKVLNIWYFVGIFTQLV